MDDLLNTTDKPFTKSFISVVNRMSLWEVAHRWAGQHPDETITKYLPTEVNDILMAMMKAQIDSELWVVNETGTALKDWTYISSWEEFVPVSNQDWDGTREDLRELYLQYMERVVKRHDEYIDRHWDIVSGKQEFDKEYLKTINVDRNNLANWALDESLPFPDFWFSTDEKAELINDHQINLLIKAKFAEFNSKGVEPPDDLYEQIRSKYINSSDEGLANVLFTPGRVKEEQIDEFWKKLSPNQKNRLLCRSVAADLWRKDKDLTIREITEHHMILDHCGGRYYTGKDTIRNWIKDLDPRPEDQKRGRPPSK